MRTRNTNNCCGTPITSMRNLDVALKQEDEEAPAAFPGESAADQPLESQSAINAARSSAGSKEHPPMERPPLERQGSSNSRSSSFVVAMMPRLSRRSEAAEPAAPGTASPEMPRINSRRRMVPRYIQSLYLIHPRAIDACFFSTKKNAASG